MMDISKRNPSQKEHSFQIYQYLIHCVTKFVKSSPQPEVSFIYNIWQIITDVRKIFVFTNKIPLEIIINIEVSYPDSTRGKATKA